MSLPQPWKSIMPGKSVMHAREIRHGRRAEPSTRLPDLQGANPLVYNALATSRSLMADSAGVLFEALLALMNRLRGEGGCPWDREQTRASLKPYLIEETYEALQAFDEGNADHITEELGDVLFQVVFHCQIAQEHGEFTMAEVLHAVLAKMTRRHPHVFGTALVEGPQEVLSQWERIKQAEAGTSGASRSALDGVPQ